MRNVILALLFLCPMQLIGQALWEKANTFLSSLSPSLRSQAQFDLKSEERFNMNFVPMIRKGPTFHDFNDTQKKAALELLRASLSEKGYFKATEIMELEKVLVIIENNRLKLSNGRPGRDPLNYHFCVFGTPSAEGPWGWRFEGHHISLNFMNLRNEIVSSTPSFFGSNPGIVGIEEQKGKFVLRMETELAFQLVNSLNEEQLKIAKVSEQAPSEIITGNDRKAEVIEPKGIQYNQLTIPQQGMLVDLMKVYVLNYEMGFARKLLTKINNAGIENLYFAWAGSTSPGAANYYRIQGPMLLIEYDNTQNNANHIHTVVRDLTNDFAEDILREHYRNHHK